tara:strand:- start:1599 stop:2459 length:861 start_codon:yes stop_codon:yes gene_type:complete
MGNTVEDDIDLEVDNTEEVGTTPNERTTFEWGTASKMIEWTLLLFILLFITSRIIKGIPPSDQIPGVQSEKPKAIWVFALLSYMIMIMVKVIANRNVDLRTREEKEKVKGWWQVLNIMIYFTIVILAYTFCISYLCMKVRRRPVSLGQFGGMFDWMNKGDGDTSIDPSIQMIIVIGVLLVILNAFTNVFLYLKSKEKSERDNVARVIYQAQLTILLLMVMTIFFLIVLGTFTPADLRPSWGDASGWEVFNTTRGEVFKTSMYIVILAVGTALVNVGASSGFFGLTK